ncbi:MAG: hypothetical protein M3083_12510 [Actinomycetota bacterium]|nr:hypothetical protein [Actinomycetota bacterium]
MTMTQNSCGCGSADASIVGSASAPCSCGCCGPQPASKEERLAELRSLRDSIDQQLAELENA